MPIRWSMAVEWVVGIVTILAYYSILYLGWIVCLWALRRRRP